jgi:hypothetical protein
MGFYDKPQTVHVSINGLPIATWPFGPLFRAGTPIHLPAKAWEGAPSILVTFEIDPPYNPSKIGIGPDSRDLGVFLRGLTIRSTPK